MKREIKFRVWAGAKMVYDITVGKFGAFYVNPMSKGNGLDENDSACITPFNTRYPDDTPVMQFTGLLDKHEKEIYEGDVLRFPAKDDWEKINYGCYEVFFHDGDANSDYNIGYSINRSYYHGSVCGGYIPSFNPKQVSKMIRIGNIYENPELLKE